MPDIICAGFGGQGVLTVGLIIARTGMNNDKNVTWIPSYGSEMRGGTANCNVKIADGKISSPFVKEIDILVAMNKPSIKKFEPRVSSNGLIIANKSIVKDWNFRKDVRVLEVEATAIADELENPKGANIAMLGALAKSGELFEKDIMKKGIQEFFISKGKDIEKNSECFDKGFDSAISL